MKTLLTSLSLILATLAINADAKPVAIKDYNWSITDVADLGLKKEDIFDKMDRKFIKLGSSICSNRALMWLNDMKKQYNVDGAKIFLFYTNKSGGAGLKTWWYHVAPVIAENEQLYVADAGFQAIKSTLKIQDWLGTFSTGANCKEIQANETDLIQLMNEGQQFPTTTRYGTYDCYYKIVPAGLWFPTTVADSLMGQNVPNEIQQDEVYSACLEAVTKPLGRFFGLGKNKCKKYLK